MTEIWPLGATITISIILLGLTLGRYIEIKRNDSPFVILLSKKEYETFEVIILCFNIFIPMVLFTYMFMYGISFLGTLGIAMFFISFIALLAFIYVLFTSTIMFVSLFIITNNLIPTYDKETRNHPRNIRYTLILGGPMLALMMIFMALECDIETLFKWTIIGLCLLVPLYAYRYIFSDLKTAYREASLGDTTQLTSLLNKGEFYTKY